MQTNRSFNLYSSIKVLFSICLIFVLVAIYLCSAVWLILHLCDSFFNIYEYPFFFAIAEIFALLFGIFILSVIVGLITKTPKNALINKLATFPNKHNYNWQGGYSVIVFSILLIITLFRSISCLQLGKYIFRKFYSASKDVASKRSNVPPVFQELYFLLWIIFLCIQLNLRLFNPLIFALDVYFIIESLTWIIYYSVFRRFFEEKYSIYHVLEHLPLILLLIPAQAIAYAKIVSSTSPNLGWQDVLVVLLGQAERNQILFSSIGFLYSAIVISMILSMFPSENIKRGNPSTLIIGAGDVVKNRLLPAILRRNVRISSNRRGTISVYDLKDGISISDWPEVSKLWNLLGLPTNENTKSLYDLAVKKQTDDESIAWISTPSNTHWYYLDMLHENCSFLVVEKPLTSQVDEIDKFKDYIQSEYRDKTFFLSYYLLEKGLPLTFLCRPKSLYTKYLTGYDATGNQITDEAQSHSVLESYYRAYLASGKVLSFSMRIIEGSDYRKLPDGGQLLETFIHNCIMASLFAGLPESWGNVRFKSLKEDQIEMTALGRNCTKINLLLSKRANNNEEQYAEIITEDAIIKADLKAKTATITTSDDTITIGIKKRYEGKYDVQCSMVYDCYDNKLKTSEIDGLYNQIETIEWLMRILKEHKH